MAVLMTLDDPEHALRGDQLCAVGARHCFALLRRHLIDLLLFAPAGAQCTELVRYPPNAILIGHQHVTVAPRETIGPIKILDVAFTEVGAPAAARITQQSQVPSALFRE